MICQYIKMKRVKHGMLNVYLTIKRLQSILTVREHKNNDKKYESL